jgi:short-subunit dehydrogenase
LKDNGMATETVSVTGASSGIGLEPAKSFAADGSDLVLVARRKDRLEKLATELSDQYGVDTRVIPADLADSAAPNTIFEQLAASGVQIDVLVNNAGFGVPAVHVEAGAWRYP